MLKLAEDYFLDYYTFLTFYTDFKKILTFFCNKVTKNCLIICCKGDMICLYRNYNSAKILFLTLFNKIKEMKFWQN